MGKADIEADIETGADEADLDAADALARMAADTLVDERVSERRRTRWLRQLAAEATTFATLLDALAENGATLTVSTTAGSSHRGRVTALADDAVVLTDDTAHRSLSVVALAHVVAVETDHIIAAEPAGPRSPRTLRDLLGDLAVDEPSVSLLAVGGTTLTGRLHWVGDDLVTLRARDLEQVGRHGASRIAPLRYVRLSSVVAVSASASG